MSQSCVPYDRWKVTLYSVLLTLILFSAPVDGVHMDRRTVQ